jgi:alanyl-tRNA synthetase
VSTQDLDLDEKEIAETGEGDAKRKVVSVDYARRLRRDGQNAAKALSDTQTKLDELSATIKKRDEDDAAKTKTEAERLAKLEADILAERAARESDKKAADLRVRQSEVKAAAVKANAHDADAVLKFVDVEKLGDDEAMNKALDDLKKSSPFLFKSAEDTQHQRSVTTPSGTRLTGNDELARIAVGDPKDMKAFLASKGVR